VSLKCARTNDSCHPPSLPYTTEVTWTRSVQLLFAVGIVFFLSACANRPLEQPSSPSRPLQQASIPSVPCPPTTGTPPTQCFETAKVIGVTILPDVSEMKVGDTIDFQVQLQLDPPGGLPPKIAPPPPGTSFGPFWETDNPAVAAVTSGGRLTALRAGEATLSVGYLGRSATRMLRIIP